MTTPVNNLVQFKSVQPQYAENINYNPKRNTQTAPDQNFENDMFLLQAMEQQNAQKKANSQDRWNKAGVLAQIGIATGFLGSLGLGILALKKGGAKAAEDEMKKLTKVTLKWVDKGTDKSVAKLDSKTTAKALQDKFKTIIDGSTENFTEAGKKWAGVTKGTDIIYLYGHGGTGKTYVAEQYAQEIGAMFTSIKYPDIGSMFKDGASMKINNFFDEIIKGANQYKDRKVVVCIDEIDALMKVVKDSAHGSDEAGKSRAALLTGLDRVKKECNNVTIIATSNYHPKNGIVDPIALRRFNSQVLVPLPDKTQAKALLEMYLKDVGAVTETKFMEKSEAKNFVNKLVKEGYSNGEIALIAEEASKFFKADIKGVADADLKKHPFKVKYLEDALKTKGGAASKTNKLMDVKGKGSNPTNETRPSLWQIIRALWKGE